jgi:hypothetical protein
MAPPKSTEPGSTTRPTRVQTKSRGPLEENEQQQPEIVDINEIPSPEIPPVSPTPILEEIQWPQPEELKEDMQAESWEPMNEEEEPQQEVLPESTKLAMEGNNTTHNRGSEGKSDELQVPSLNKQTEETAGTTSAWPEWITRKQMGIVGTSYQEPQ